MNVGELLRRFTTGRAVFRDRIEPALPRSEVVFRPREEGILRETAAARRLLEWQRKMLGPRHPSYATALMNLAVLLQKQGDRENAQPLVAQALAIRERVLGASHPDVASSRNFLNSLLDIGSDWNEPPLEPRHSLPAPGRHDHERLLCACHDAFDETRDRLLGAVRGLLAEPSPPVPGTLLAELMNGFHRFFDLHDRAKRLGMTAESTPASGDLATLMRDIAERLTVATRAEILPERHWETRRRALGTLDWVLALTAHDRAEIPTLRDVLAQARHLHRTIAAAPLPELPLDAFPLATGLHPLALLLRLIALRDTLRDESWEDLRIAVSLHFGRALSGAAARGRIVFNEPTGNPGVTQDATASACR